MKFTFLSVNMNTLYITIFDLSRKKIQFVNVLLVIHIMWRTMESHTLGNELTESMVLNKKSVRFGCGAFIDFPCKF